MLMNLNMGPRTIRKVNYTYIISVPKVWLDNVGAKVGDCVQTEITEQGDLLIRLKGREQ
jgi:bifunctional DNA-binding transcriptional regulator/antitoxin component of YhaV-PrlF toxin-antitoxin module